MPDYSDEEIDKISDDISESEDVSEAKHGKEKRHDQPDSYLRQRNGTKFGHDNPAFIDDTHVNSKAKKSNINKKSECTFCVDSFI